MKVFGEGFEGIGEDGGKRTFKFKTIQAISSLDRSDLRTSDSTAIRDMDSALRGLEALAKDATPNRHGAADADLVDLGELVDYSDPVRNRVLARRFEEVEECAGDSLFTEFYGNGRIEEQRHSAIHHLRVWRAAVIGYRQFRRPKSHPWV